MPRSNSLPPRISGLVSNSSRMHCDLLAKAFDSVRQRFQVVSSVCDTVQILTALENHRPQVAIISSHCDAVLCEPRRTVYPPDLHVR